MLKPKDLLNFTVFSFICLCVFQYIECEERHVTYAPYFKNLPYIDFIYIYYFLNLTQTLAPKDYFMTEWKTVTTT